MVSVICWTMYGETQKYVTSRFTAEIYTMSTRIGKIEAQK